MQKDLTLDCEKEPIHIPGAIQSHGILIALRQSDFTILQISESVETLLGIMPSDLIHQPLSRLMAVGPVERAAKRLGERTPRLLNPIPIEIEANGRKLEFDGIMHRSGRTLILELENHIKDSQYAYGGFGGFYESVRNATTKIMTAHDLDEVLALCCDEMRRLTSFNRVLIYRFDEDWNGQVITESKTSNIDTLMHHRFPAADIPRQARELYAVNWLRIIPDANYVPSRLIPPINPITEKPLDLSNSVLRSVSPVHVEYMKNLGQMASMSVSLLKGRKLWGLISCHHSEPLFLQYNVRVAAEFVGQMVSAQIVAREDATTTDHRLQLKAIYDELLRSGGTYHELPAALVAKASSLLALVDAQGAAICLGDEVRTVGFTPPPDVIKKIVAWVEETGREMVSTNELSQMIPEAKDWVATAAGLLALHIPRAQHGGVILWFRPEIQEEIPWAGNPHLTKQASADGLLHPRTSFATWLETVTCKAKRWSPAELEIADELRTAIMGMSLREHSERPSIPVKALKAEAKIETPAISTEQEISHVIETFPEFAAVFLDPRAHIISWSEGAQQLFGFSKDEVHSKGIDVVFGEEDVLKDRHEQTLRKARSQGRSDEELWLYRKDKTSFWGKLSVARALSESGNILGYSVVAQDLSRERFSEDALRSAKLQAEAANMAKSAFIANVSHEIRTPLSSILGFAEMMGRFNLNQQEKSEYIERIRRNGDQLSTLINDLLEATKVEAGKIEVERMPCRVREVIEDVVGNLSTKAHEKGVALTVDVNPSVPDIISTDPTRLRQILTNLIGNAIKFTKSGDTVEIAATADSVNARSGVAFRVTDSGIGMTELEMSKLFQPFVQADASTTRKFGGTGLGLYVSRRLARALGGDLNIERSEPGRGTTFLLLIDSTQTRDSAVARTLPGAVAAGYMGLGENVLSGKSVLVVDDVADNRRLIGDFLKRCGASVDFAADGQEGVEKALAKEFDIVVMDIQMPRLDGNEAFKRLRASGYEKPIVALTAHALKDDRQYSSSLGFNGYLTKPIQQDELVGTLAQLLKQRSN